MILSFITNKDIDVSLKEYFLNQVVIGDSHVLKKAEAAAVSLMRSKLNSRYDLTKVFPLIREWKADKAYLKDEYTSINDVIYKAAEDNTNQRPNAPMSTAWAEDDPRDMLLVLHCTNITLYYILKRTRKLSDDVINAYHDALDWLDDVKRERENPTLPLLEAPDGMDIKWGSNEKMDHYY